MAVAMAMDVTSEELVNAAVAQVVAAYGGVGVGQQCRHPDRASG